LFSSPAAIIGFLIGAGVPITAGIIMLQAHWAHVASLPPGDAACGMSALGAFGLILFAGPVGGFLGCLFGAAAGWLGSQVRRTLLTGFSAD
jgi:hypothetical protein